MPQRSKVIETVTQIIRSVGNEEAYAKFRRLTARDIHRKAGGDLVTMADLRIEERLTVALTRLLPGSSVVGEETVSSDPGSLAALDGDGPVWVIDPVDGTANFVAGSPDFAVLVALCENNRIIASWTYAPAKNLMAIARTGMGATVNGRPVPPQPDRALASWRVVVTGPDYATAAERESRRRLQHAGLTTVPCICAGLAYVNLALGRYDAVALGWEKPWDHSAGLLLHSESGGHNSAIDGRPFRPSGGNALPLVAAPTADSLRKLRMLLS